MDRLKQSVRKSIKIVWIFHEKKNQQKSRDHRYFWEIWKCIYFTGPPMIHQLNRHTHKSQFLLYKTVKKNFSSGKNWIHYPKSDCKILLSREDDGFTKKLENLKATTRDFGKKKCYETYCQSSCLEIFFLNCGQNCCQICYQKNHLGYSGRLDHDFGHCSDLQTCYFDHFDHCFGRHDAHYFGLHDFPKIFRRIFCHRDDRCRLCFAIVLANLKKIKQFQRHV